MVNAPKVEALLRNLAAYVVTLQRLARLDKAAFLNDQDKIGSAKYNFQTAIEACIDIGNQLIASER